MTEVPEHLLRRSKERRAALSGGGGGDDEGGGNVPASPAEEPGGGSAAPARAEAAAAPAKGGAEALPTMPVYTGPPQVVTPRPRVPFWAMPVLAVLPFWAILYGGAFGERSTGESTDPVEIGAGVYQAAGCGTCHGGGGEGGVGPALGDVAATFPEFQAHVDWVKVGSAAVKGQPYGASGRVATGGMPGFENSLSEEEIIAVTCFERVRFGGEETPPECTDTAAGGVTEAESQNTEESADAGH